MDDEPPRPAESFDRRLRVMSFNVRYDTAEDGDRSWEHRREMVASILRFHRPDVVGLQEPLAHQLADIRERVPRYEWVGQSRREREAVGEFAPIGYRRDRFDCRGWGDFWLSETPDVPGSVGWDADCPRLVTWAELADARTDRRLLAVDAHFDHRGETARLKSARLLRERLAELAGVPAVVTGDLNLTEHDDPYAVLIGGDAPGPRLRDARYAATYPNHGPTTTFNQFEGVPDVKIDYVFVTDGVTVHQHGVIADHWDGRVPSDHRPVLAEVSLD
ncbi:MAG: endonuclease/exonuclease/phosphatase family protein [Salinigranum sp.]